MNQFNFNRGDSVIINVINKDNIIESETGIVLNVEQKLSIDTPTVETRIEVRRDKDGSLWTCDENGKSYSLIEDRKQFLQVQKVFQPVEIKRGKVISMINIYDRGLGPTLLVFDTQGKEVANVRFNLENLECGPISINYMDIRSFRVSSEE